MKAIIAEKKSNVCLSLDTSDTNKILNVVDEVGEDLCAVRLHSDLLVNDLEHQAKFQDGLHKYLFLAAIIVLPALGVSLREESLMHLYWLLVIATMALLFLNKLVDRQTTYSFIKLLRYLSKKWNFKIIEDAALCGSAEYMIRRAEQITPYADYLTVNVQQGESAIRYIEHLCIENDCQLLLIAQTPENQDLKYANEVKELATRYHRVVAGFICTENLEDPNFLYVAPYHGSLIAPDYVEEEPEMNPGSLGCDVVMVGRQILNETHPLLAVGTYNSYKDRVVAFSN